jgi:hypothetical protein
MTLTDYMNEEFNSRFNSVNACYHTVYNRFSSRLLRRNTKTKIYITVILPVVYGCETWCVILREGHRLIVFKNRVLREIFVPKREKITGYWRKLQTESFITRTAQQISRKVSNQGQRDGRGMWHEWGTGRAHTGIWSGNVKEGFVLENIGIGECIILKRMFKK